MQTKKGQLIENKSMQIIEREIGFHQYNYYEWNIVKRVIHTTADFDFAKNNKIIFHKSAIKNGIDVLKNGGNIVVDVNGVIGGLNKQNIVDFKNGIICNISNTAVKKNAKKHSKTVAQVAMRESAKYMDNSIIAIGNAPTALLEVINMCKEKIIKPSLIVGIPVGFVSASESKEKLRKICDVAFITNIGRKGGSPCASAIINALFKFVRN